MDRDFSPVAQPPAIAGTACTTEAINAATSTAATGDLSPRLRDRLVRLTPGRLIHTPVKEET
ncbi:hypothetical protein, partial [Lentzea terrae]|uniref:hypothetical protein n=1 Tax=Lentzea terrae TaxID=2200761 RepID=UPI001E4C7130